jgi:hypothetical protein
MKKIINTIRHPIALIVVLIFLLNFQTAFSQQTDFSGNWKINLKKSEFGDAPQFTASKALKVNQQSGQIKVERLNQTDLDADSTSTETLKLNGEPLEITTADKRAKKMTASLTNNGNVLVRKVAAFLPNGDNQFNAVETWSMSDDKKYLMLTMTLQDYSGFEYTIKTVYDRQ